MALRVLLADESSTIKRVMQLALQDFAVEVKSVPVGIDVLQVAQNFKPDIIFADILLAKKNGYEVATELKNDAQLSATPIVLMWSSFMEFDEQKFKQSKANQKLEKPFDAEALRNMVKDLVKKTTGNAISNYLSFPEMPSMIEDSPSANSVEAEEKTEIISRLDSMEVDEPDEFQSVPLAKQPAAQNDRRVADKPASQEAWKQQKVQDFKINLPNEAEDIGIPYEEYSPSPEELGKSSIAFSSGNEEVMLDDLMESSIKTQTNHTREAATSPSISKSQISKIARTHVQAQPIQQFSQQFTGSDSSLNQEAIESLIRQEAQKMVEDIAWKVIPDIAERVIREEIQRLMAESEKIG